MTLWTQTNLRSNMLMKKGPLERTSCRMSSMMPLQIPNRASSILCKIVCGLFLQRTCGKCRQRSLYNPNDFIVIFSMGSLSMSNLLIDVNAPQNYFRKVCVVIKASAWSLHFMSYKYLLGVCEEIWKQFCKCSFWNLCEKYFFYYSLKQIIIVFSIWWHITLWYGTGIDPCTNLFIFISEESQAMLDRVREKLEKFGCK